MLASVVLGVSAEAYAAQCQPADHAAPLLPGVVDEVYAQTQSTPGGRMVASVNINGEGPFRFIVDTGANRSALSSDLAAQLQLELSGEAQVNSVFSAMPAPLTEVDSLEYGRLALPTQPMPVLDSPVLSGEQGLLGVDGMAGRRLLLDFERHCIEISPSNRARRLHGWSEIPGRLRFGHLVVVDGDINGLRVNVLIDTGSDITLANTRLRDMLNASVHRGHNPHTYVYSINEPVVARDAIFLPRLMLGGNEARNVVALVGDYHIFDLWQLRDEPTLLLGMDVLTHARALAIDYGRGTVHLRLRRAPY